MTEVKSCLEEVVPFLEESGFTSEAQTARAIVREVDEWSKQRV